ncbi:flagellar hook-associated protein FlgK [Legionella taurinensis]|uniref:Flagellar hook-associated protein 1 n=1 Tax=Legionella taurinensis TaxID=70611 RepID=A0A3A5LH80_9GAMM|nr:flagellar hook-associated protein FlgK [Legionella taurinensis]PUT40550.1 flagellar hook-associated protein FlgK [Legionella taurinensis]PUT42795.1 flagellar hook-associated protein FlgK [Legionella taurinensis]PUT48522.1 flagellar hook-associated protein FlgK [Legionella taurinensis]RJT44189.1 flagellar hook-associated protein FlgK [Legionella taurinensis]
MGIFGIATSGLNAFQRALDVVGTNIANVKNPNYTRQTVLFGQLPSQRFAGSYIGSGVVITDIQRHADRFANQQVRDTLASKTQYEVFYEQAAQIDKLLSQDGTNITANLQNFFNALSQLNDAPDSNAARDVALKQSQTLVEQFKTMQQRIDEYQRNNSTQLREAVEQINVYAKTIADINQKLTVNQNAPDLLDQRDAVLKELSKLTDVSIVERVDGAIDVSIGTGEMLVIGTDARRLLVNSSGSNQLNAQILLDNGAGVVDITRNMQAGMIAGLLGFEDDIMVQASQVLGQMAMGLASAFNTQHRLGMDLNNQLGQNFFNDFNTLSAQLARSVANTTNTGTGVLSVEISDISQVKISDYQLYVTDTGTNEVRVIRRSDGQATTLNWTSSPPAPPAGSVTIDGMTITVDNIANLANNDSYTLTPTRGAARDLTLNLTDARQLAFASPVRTQSALTNTGSGGIRLGNVLNTTDVNKDFRIEFISPTQYNVVNVTDSVTSGPFTFTPGTDNTVMIPNALTPSYSVVLSGVPAAGDQFTAAYNTGGIADNGNGLKLTAIQQDQLFEGGTQNLFDRYSSLIGSVGGRTNQAKLNSESADMLYNQAVDLRDSKSGVNLDEEAANLLQLQQAYQAAGQLLSVAKQMMDVLFAVMR